MLIHAAKHLLILTTQQERPSSETKGKGSRSTSAQRKKGDKSKQSAQDDKGKAAKGDADSKSGKSSSSSQEEEQPSEDQFSPNVEALNLPAHEAVIKARDSAYLQATQLFCKQRNRARIEMQERYDDIEAWKASWSKLVQQLELESKELQGV